MNVELGEKSHKICREKGIGSGSLEMQCIRLGSKDAEKVIGYIVEVIVVIWTYANSSYILHEKSFELEDVDV